MNSIPSHEFLLSYLFRNSYNTYDAYCLPFSYGIFQLVELKINELIIFTLLFPYHYKHLYEPDILPVKAALHVLFSLTSLFIMLPSTNFAHASINWFGGNYSTGMSDFMVNLYGKDFI